MSFPTLTANLALTIPATLVVDLNTIWLNNKSQTAFLGAAVGSTDTTITLSAVAPNVALNSAVLIDGEPMIATAIDSTGLIYTVTRAATAYPFLALLPVPPPNTHAIGATIYALSFATPWQMLQALALRPWVQQQVIALGANSVTFGSTITGSLAVPSGS